MGMRFLLTLIALTMLCVGTAEIITCVVAACLFGKAILVLDMIEVFEPKE